MMCICGSHSPSLSLLSTSPSFSAAPPLQVAGSAVKKATETLVKAAQQASANVEQEAPFMPKLKGSVMASFREELEKKEQIAKMERELEAAKSQLYKIRSHR